MRKNIIILFVLIFSVISCDKPPIEKPEHLIKRNKMIDMMVDIHLAEATFQSRRYQDSLVKRSSSADFYYSVLNEYQVPDSVFEKSFVYYASNPKKFEKMYQDVMNKLNEMDLEFSDKEKDELNLGTKRKRD